MNTKVILLVEDNPDDEALTMRALKGSNITNAIVVARDGVEAIAYLFGTGPYAGRDTSDQPAVILLDLKLPKLDGFDVLKQLRADDRTKLLPVVLLTSSNEQRDLIRAMGSALTVTFASRWTSASSPRRLSNLASIGW